MITDNDIKSEIFLGHVNSIITTGEIHSFISNDENEDIAFECVDIYIKEMEADPCYQPSLV